MPNFPETEHFDGVATFTRKGSLENTLSAKPFQAKQLRQAEPKNSQAPHLPQNWQRGQKISQRHRLKLF